MKILSQILIVILAVALVAGATFLIVTQTGSNSALTSDRPSFDGTGHTFGDGGGPGNGQDLRGEGGEPFGSGVAWLAILKNVAIFAVFTGLISLVRAGWHRLPRQRRTAG